MLLPFLSEFDPEVTSEGSLDPLGLYPMADRLASKLVPGLRERMAHPRFLTAMAVGNVLCSEFDVDEVAADGVSEPWQVYEWYVVQALYRTFFKNEPDHIRGLPGRLKAAAAYDDNVPLSAARYLKTAYVFGFHGVYRTLAKDINLIDSRGNLSEFGNQLVTVWEKEQKLEGFYTTNSGDGRALRAALVQAVRYGLQEGAVAHSWDWNRFETIARHLAPYKGGHKEMKLIFDAVISSQAPLRKELVEYLCTKEGADIWKSEKSEKRFHAELQRKASSELRQILEAVDLYEWFCRLLQDAFDECLYVMSINEKAAVDTLALGDAVVRASELVPTIFEQVIRLLEPHISTGDFHETYASLGEVREKRDWLRALLDLHVTIQRRKPPHGKRPWFEKLDNYHFMIYLNYKRKTKPQLGEEYVQFYRTAPLWSFLLDFGKVGDEKS